MNRINTLGIIFTAFKVAFFPASAWSTYHEPLHDIHKIFKGGEIRQEQIVRVPTARVVVADYELIRRDFAAELAGKNEKEIDKWLLDNAGFIAKSQIESKANVSSEIPVSKEVKKGYRPIAYGRAMIYEIEEGKLIDAKGVGARQPSQSNSGNGLFTLGEAKEN